MDKFLIVDGNSIANRAFYALPFLSNHEGKASGAVFGFANILIKLITEQKPTHIAVAFDHARKTFRNEIYADYKGQRKPTPPELITQFPVIKEMLQTMDIKTFEYENIEADDIIGTLTKNCDCEKILLSGDRDLLQLINENTFVWLTKKGVTEVKKVDLKVLQEEYNLSPSQVIELKGLMGDTSDNIKGVKGIGEKTAYSLLEEYGDINGIYKNIDKISGKLKEKLIEGKEDAYISKTLATIKTDCDFPFNIEECKLKFPFNERVHEFFVKWDFSSLVKNNSLFGKTITPIKKAEREELTKDILTAYLASIQKDFVNKSSSSVNYTLSSTVNQTASPVISTTSSSVISTTSSSVISTVAEGGVEKSLPKQFAYNLKKMTFAFNKDKEYYLNDNYTMFGSELSLEQACQILKPIFEDKNVVKLSIDAKSDLHYLKKLGIKFVNYFDLSLAHYLISAGLKNGEITSETSGYYDLHNNYMETLKEEGLNKVYEEIELPLVEILVEMEESGFQINERKLDDLDSDYTIRLEKLSKEIYEIAGEEFNINSPKQVASVLFDKLKIETWNNKKQSTAVGVLEEVRYIPIVDLILKHRKLSKLKNTYIDVYKKLCKEGGNIIHTTFNQALTSTGRLSSSEPNLQTIPTRDEEGRELRKIFESKFEGGSLISADYNQIELRLLADMSGEEHLIEAYKRGEDIHTLTACQIFGVSKPTADQRREAKAVNFGIIYGIIYDGLSQNIKSSRAKAKSYIDSYFSRYPKVKEFMDKNVEEATKTGYIKTMFGRIRRIPELSSSKYQTRSFGQRVAMNMPMQGSASDIIKLAMINVQKALKGKKSQLILQIHDELIIDTYKGEEEEVEKLLRREMENVVKLKVPLVATVGKGKNLYECK